MCCLHIFDISVVLPVLAIWIQGQVMEQKLKSLWNYVKLNKKGPTDEGIVCNPCRAMGKQMSLLKEAVYSKEVQSLAASMTSEQLEVFRWKLAGLSHAMTRMEYSCHDMVRKKTEEGLEQKKIQEESLEKLLELTRECFEPF